VSCIAKCVSPHVIPNRIDHTWRAAATSVFPYTSSEIAAISGYILNNASSIGPVTVSFLRGGIAGATLPLLLVVQPGEYKSFTIIGVDTIKIDPGTNVATGEINININFNPF
jgi:hypothetical protein